MISIDRNPTELKASNCGELGRPEAIAFSPDGRLCAIANSIEHAVAIYRKSNDRESMFDGPPWLRIQDDMNLNYVHGVAFSPDGRELVTVAREAHALAGYRINDSDIPASSPAPDWVINGPEFGLEYPGGVGFHPSGNYLIVANRMGKYALCVFRRMPRTLSGYGFMPGRSITRDALRSHDIATPHDICFDRSGKYMLSGHTGFFREPGESGKSGVAVTRCDQFSLETGSFRVLNKVEAAHVHSLDIHSIKEYVAISDSNHGLKIYRASENYDALTESDSISFHPKGEVQGFKGVAFEPGGEGLLAVNTDNQLLRYPLSSRND